jgi:hypothetical protein
MVWEFKDIREPRREQSPGASDAEMLGRRTALSLPLFAFRSYNRLPFSLDLVNILPACPNTTQPLRANAIQITSGAAIDL